MYDKTELNNINVPQKYTQQAMILSVDPGQKRHVILASGTMAGVGTSVISWSGDLLMI